MFDFRGVTPAILIIGAVGGIVLVTLVKWLWSYFKALVNLF